MAALEARGVVVGDNEPYDGALPGDTLHEHVTAHGLAGLLVEVRQDLVATPETARGWADLLAEVLGANPGAAGNARNRLRPKPCGARPGIRQNSGDFAVASLILGRGAAAGP